MIPEFLFIAAALVVGLAVFAVLRQDQSAFVSNLRARIEALKVHLGQREALLQDTGELSSKHAFLESSCTELNDRKLRFEEDLEILGPKVGKIVEEVTAKAGERTQIEAQLREMEEEKRKWEDRIKELDRLDEVIGETVKKQREFDGQIEETEEKIAGLTESLKTAEAANANLAQLRLEIQAMEETRSEVLSAVEKARSEESELQKRMDKLKAEVDQLEQNKRLLEGVQMMVAESGSNGKGKALSRSAFTSLFKPEFPKSEQLADENPDHRFRGFQQYLNAHSYAFSERLVNAFHTSLKVQDVSCLTVMAGISGTGKSALPRLYADYMGIHFLLVPVEPRWDSPQDLFGFLNYMENRYEATPLGRALNQFNLRDAAIDQPMQDEILLVLLDEMNLARVEYYFSEFLSRLETRRDVDWKSDSEAYQKVSMEIFGGSEKKTPIDGDSEAEESLNQIRLFAGPNVFFVGTMNEDESTQSLTDKVIDRSNAIHFGRPKNLMARSEGGATVTNRKLSFGAWQKNLRNGLRKESRTGSEVDQFLSRLNEHFDSLGRPFGHRAFAATCAYVANHPMGLKDDLSELQSLADQVAMRFLPKLRGVDLNEHQSTLSNIRRQLSELDDNAVLNAFDSANDRVKGYFQWKGIDWNL